VGMVGLPPGCAARPDPLGVEPVDHVFDNSTTGDNFIPHDDGRRFDEVVKPKHFCGVFYRG
jgi:hypothetical protein